MLSNDEELIHLCRRKKREGQQQLFERYKRRVMGICLRYANGRIEADDILQEAFIKIFKSLEKPERHKILSLEGWIVKITINTAINLVYRGHANQSMRVELDQVINVSSKSESPLDKLTMNDLLKLIQALPAGYRVIFNLFLIEGYDHQEIAKKLNISESTSRSQLTRAKQWLIDRLPTSRTKKDHYEKVNR